MKREKKYTWRIKKETFLSFQYTQRYIFSSSEKKKDIFRLIHWNKGKIPIIYLLAFPEINYFC
ncbi:MAG: hypothetical protein D3915_01610 [Candidatus Electrothrix sp. AU1_5]|nr:hypothetical protein [Candidatus Electrothrix gigas]